MSFEQALSTEGLGRSLQQRIPSELKVINLCWNDNVVLRRTIVTNKLHQRIQPSTVKWRPCFPPERIKITNCCNR